MKKQLKIAVFFYLITGMFLLKASSFQIAIPQNLIEQNATLLLLVCDEKGKKSFKKCRLANTGKNTITQEELETALETLEHTDADLESNACNLPYAAPEESVVFYFQLDSHLQVLRVMLLKDCLLDNDPFDIVEFPLSAEMEFDQFYEDMQDIDELEELTNNLDNADLSQLNDASDISAFEKYVLYLKVITSMYYHKVKRAISFKEWN